MLVNPETRERTQTLSGYEVLGTVFKGLEKRLSLSRQENQLVINFPPGQLPKAETPHHWYDMHRSETDYFTYNRLLLLPIGQDERVWAVGLGKNPRKINAWAYYQDLIALPMVPQQRSEGGIIEEFQYRIEREAFHLRSSLIVATTNGELAISQNGMFRHILLDLPSRTRAVIAASEKGGYPLQVGSEIGLDNIPDKVPTEFNPVVVEDLERAIVDTLVYQNRIIGTFKGVRVQP